MSNPTLGVWQMNDTLVGYTPAGSLAFVGINPTRFSNGAWFEESTTNLFRNPRAAVDTAEVGVNSAATLTRVTDRSVVGPASFRIERIAGGTHGFYHNSKMTGFATSDPVTVSMQCESNDNLYVRIGLNTYTGGGALVSLLNGSIVAVPASFDTVSATFTVPATATQVLPEFAFFSSGAGAASATGTVAYATVLQTEKKDHATSYTDGSLGAGYASVGTLWASAHTRAASSASVTIAEPAAIACWYREAYSGAKSFAYIEPYGTLGTYGSIAYAAGDLTISTTRNLVIGPFAAFDRALTATEQANLRSTQNWTMNSVNGSNIILPLSGARRRRR